MRKDFVIDRYNWDYSLEHYSRCLTKLYNLSNDSKNVTDDQVYMFIQEQIDLVERIIDSGFSKIVEITTSNLSTEPRWIPCTFLDMLEPEKIKEQNLIMIEKWG